MNDYKFSFKIWIADIAFLLGAIVLWYANFLGIAFLRGSISGSLGTVVIIAVTVVLSFLCYTFSKAFMIWRKKTGYLYWLSVYTVIIAVAAGIAAVISADYLLIYWLLTISLYPYLVIGVAVIFFGYKFIRAQMDRKPDRLRR